MQSPTQTHAQPATAEQASAARFWTRACALFAALAILKTLHAPNSWAYSQALLTYQAGAVRRCLFGTVLAALHLHTYLQFSTVSAWTLVLLFAATAMLAKQAGLFRRAGTGRLAAVFAASFALSYTVDLVGYLDNVILLLTVLALLLRHRPAVYLPVAAAVAAACVLVHENAVFYAVPLLLAAPLAGLLKHAPAGSVPVRQTRERSLAIATIVAIVIATAGPLAIVLLKPVPTLAQAAALGARIQTTTPTPLRMDFFYVQSATLPRLLRLMLGYYRNPDYWLAQLQAALAFLPAAGLFLYLSLRLLPPRRLDRTLCVIASLAPLAMHALGWDVYRWDSLAVWTSFLVFVLLAPASESTHLSRGVKNATLIILVMNAAAGPGLLGGEPMHAFPDVHQIPVAVRLLLGRPQHAHPALTGLPQGAMPPVIKE